MELNMNDIEVKDNGNGHAVGSGEWRVSQASGYQEPVVDLSLRSFRNEAEIHAIHCALRHTGWNRKRAAKLLLISYRCLLYKIRQHNITPVVG
jgi:DNA-binding NtrC family response regulator